MSETSILCLVAAALVLCAERRLLRAPGAGVAATHAASPPFPLSAKLYLAAVLIGSVSLRAWLCTRYPMHSLENFSVVRACDFEWSALAQSPESLYHAPLQPLFLRAWLAVFDGAAGELGLLAVRLPNLLIAGVSIFLLARLGALLRAPLAGLAAATMLAFLPLSLRFGIPQENYLYELCGALWFAERCVRYLVWRERVYRSLAVSAGVALWCGYMNVPILALGAVLLGAAALRRRQLREALFTFAVIGLLCAPLVSPLARAGVSYAAISASTEPGDDGRAQREAAAHHPMMPAAQAFSRGRIDVALQKVAEACFGPCSFLFFAGALLVAVRRRAFGWPLLVLLLAFPVLGTRLLLNAQNYAAVIPFFFLCTTFGIDALVELVARENARRRLIFGAAAQVLVVALALTGGYAKEPLFAPPDPASFFFEYSDVSPLVRARDESPPDTPLLIYDLFDAQVLSLSFCEKSPSACARARCASSGDPGSEVRSGPWRILTRDGREVATPFGDAHDAPSHALLLPGLSALFERPAWSARGALVLRSHGKRSSPELSALEVFVTESCALLADVPPMTLSRCAPLHRAAAIEPAPDGSRAPVRTTRSSGSP